MTLAALYLAQALVAACGLNGEPACSSMIVDQRTSLEVALDLCNFHRDMRLVSCRGPDCLHTLEVARQTAPFAKGWEACSKIDAMEAAKQAETMRRIESDRVAQDAKDKAFIAGVAEGRIK